MLTLVETPPDILIYLDQCAAQAGDFKLQGDSERRPTLEEDHGANEIQMSAIRGRVIGYYSVPFSIPQFLTGVTEDVNT